MGVVVIQHNERKNCFCVIHSAESHKYQLSFDIVIILAASSTVLAGTFAENCVDWKQLNSNCILTQDSENYVERQSIKISIPSMISPATAQTMNILKTPISASTLRFFEIAKK